MNSKRRIIRELINSATRFIPLREVVRSVSLKDFGRHGLVEGIAHRNGGLGGWRSRGQRRPPTNGWR